MTEKIEYRANAGQTYEPVTDNIHVPFLPFEHPAKPNPLLPELKLTQEAIDKGYELPSQKQHFLPGVTSEMMDWFWANMEKCYPLWAPGAHKKFLWVRSPAEVGFEKAALLISEAAAENIPVFGGEGVVIERLPMTEFFPFTTCLKHVVCEGIYNEKGEFFDSTTHMWEDVEGGVNHITATVSNPGCSVPPGFILDILKEDPDYKPTPNWATDHEDYEASQWPVFLPTLYNLWKNHPDPSQNVQCNLEVYLGEDGRYHYVAENGPVTV